MSKRINLNAVAAVTLAVYSLPAMAKEGGGSLPQLDATTYPGQLFWLAICFPVLFLLMRFLAVPRVQRAQSKRKRLLRIDLDAAESSNKEASAMRESYEKALNEARSKAQSVLHEIATAAAGEEAKRRAAQQEELNRRIAEAEQRISALRQQAVSEAKEAAADLANAVVNQLLAPKKASI